MSELDEKALAWIDDRYRVAQLDGDHAKQRILERLRSLLASAPAPTVSGEPVAWQWRFRAVYTDRKGEWSQWNDGRKPVMSGTDYDVEERPLYSHPAFAKMQRDRDRLEECRAEAERERDEDWRRANAAEAELAKARTALREIATLVPRLSLIGRIASAAFVGEKP